MTDNTTVSQDTSQAQEVTSTISRRQRREMHRKKLHEYKKDVKTAETNAKNLSMMASAMRSSYATSYAAYCEQHPSNDKGLQSVELPLTIELIPVALSDLVREKQLDLSRIEQCMMPDNKDVRTMYLRMDIVMRFSASAELTARPGVPEEITEEGEFKVLRQLLYHALLPIEDDAKDTQILATEKLLSDFVMHMFCMGVDMQQMNNSTAWNNRLQRQSSNIDEKVAEITQMFASASGEKEKTE